MNANNIEPPHICLNGKGTNDEHICCGSFVENCDDCNNCLEAYPNCGKNNNTP